ncbi:MAG: hypothetical protein AVDCRST_MAG32-2861, partial [uncultured Nocardioides sp.]
VSERDPRWSCRPRWRDLPAAAAPPGRGDRAARGGGWRQGRSPRCPRCRRGDLECLGLCGRQRPRGRRVRERERSSRPRHPRRSPTPRPSGRRVRPGPGTPSRTGSV